MTAARVWRSLNNYILTWNHGFTLITVCNILNQTNVCSASNLLYTCVFSSCLSLVVHFRVLYFQPCSIVWSLQWNSAYPRLFLPVLLYAAEIWTSAVTSSLEAYHVNKSDIFTGLAGLRHIDNVEITRRTGLSSPPYLIIRCRCVVNCSARNICTPDTSRHLNDSLITTANVLGLQKKELARSDSLHLYWSMEKCCSWTHVNNSDNVFVADLITH